jgi:hypothetical protein
MISVLFCSRVKDNPASNLPGLLESMADCTTPQERAQVEFLIKFDDDDPYRVSEAQLKKYPFQIRSWVYSRGEGRHGLHHAQEYLFAQRDPRSRFCLMTADDFKFTRPGFVSEILGIQDEFVILGYRRPPIESYAGRYEEEAMIRQWVVSIGEWSPVISTRLIEVCQNFGWQSNVDSWLIALSVVLYDLYKIVLWRQHEPFYLREGGAGLGNTPTYNNMELTDKIGPCNRYWFELVRRQARNVFLNMEYGTDLKHVPASAVPQRLWRKFRSQPLHRLPIRLCRRIGRDLGLLPT